MSVLQTELVYRKSATGSSDGGAVSGSLLTSGLKNDLWPNISDVNRLAGGTRYKKIFICNDAVVDSLVVPSIWNFQQPTNITQQIGFGHDDSVDDNSLQGNMTAWAAGALAAFVSSAADTRTLTIWGLDGSSIPQTESVTMNGTTEVLSVGTYTKVFGCLLSATGAQTVTIKQGTGGTTRGTIGASEVTCWIWLDANIKADGIMLPSLLAFESYGIWLKQSWIAGAAGVRPDAAIVAVEEN